MFSLLLCVFLRHSPKRLSRFEFGAEAVLVSGVFRVSLRLRRIARALARVTQ